jgi:hypothetical protein
MRSTFLCLAIGLALTILALIMTAVAVSVQERNFASVVQLFAGIFTVTGTFLLIESVFKDTKKQN